MKIVHVDRIRTIQVEPAPESLITSVKNPLKEEIPPLPAAPRAQLTALKTLKSLSRYYGSAGVLCGFGYILLHRTSPALVIELAVHTFLGTSLLTFWQHIELEPL